MTSQQSHTSATRRLLRDFKEVLQHPLPNVVACPLEDDIFVWHGNVRGDVDSDFTAVPFHFRLNFPDNYPLTAPKISLYTRLPHPNVVSQKGRPRWRLALWDCNPTEDGWSCGYTVHSVLLQLQAFLIAEDMMWHTSQVTLEAAIAAAENLVISDHPHTGENPYPAFHTAEALAAAEVHNKQRKAVVLSPSQKCSQTTLKPEYQQNYSKPAECAPAAEALKSVAKPDAAKPDAAEKSKAPEAASQEKDAAGDAAQGSWKVVQKKAVNKQGVQKKKVMHKGKASHKGKMSQNVKASPQAKQAVCQPVKPELPSAPKSANPFAPLMPVPKAVPAKAVTAAPELPKEAAAKGELSKAAKKNAKRSKKRANKTADAPEAPQTPEPSTPPPALPGPEPSSSTTPAPHNDAGSANVDSGEPEAWSDVPQKKSQGAEQASEEKTVAELISEVRQSAGEEVGQSQSAQNECRYCAASLDMGLFSYLPPDIMTTLFTQLDRKDIAMLGSTCKGLRDVCCEGDVWRLLLQRDFCGSQVTATQSSGWKSAYLLQSNNIVGDLQCYYSKASFEDQVLGMPAHYTINPRTDSIDYIQVHAELLSLAAFKQGVRTTCAKTDGGDVQVVIPAYLNEDHFQRALPLLPGILRKLTRGVSGNTVPPVYWLDACAKMMNTAVVLLMDKGVEASQKAISSYCSVHRLLLALADHYNLWDEATKRLDAFLAKDSNRTKDKLPNLGWLIAMMTVSPKHKWGNAAVPLLLESLDRGVLWACKAKHSLVQRYQVPEATGGVDQELVDGVFEASRIGCSLLAFHSAFLHFIARPPGVAIDKVMEQSDILYGNPSEGQVRRMQKAVARIQGVTDWQQQLQLLGVKPEGRPEVNAFMTKVLRRAWRNSLRKGYHAKDTDFSRIHASGVSNILLKGQSYTAPPNIKGLELVDLWRWSGEVHYLDSSMLLYGNDGLICTVDWQRHESFGTKIVGAARHSGDIMDFDECRGKQTMSIRLADLGEHVTAMYCVASGWQGVPLADIKQPHIVVKDAAEGSVLCEYHLEDKSAIEYSVSTALVMCCIQRQASGGWKVVAVGDCLPRGFANSVHDYMPIKEHIDRIHGVTH